jgi:hypothetical protein
MKATNGNKSNFVLYELNFGKNKKAAFLMPKYKLKPITTKEKIIEIR